MYKHILIPTDGSALANKAVTHGVVFGREIGAKVTVVICTEPFVVVTLSSEMIEYTEQNYNEIVGRRAKRVLDAAAAKAQAAGVVYETVHVEHAHPYQGIIDTAEKRGCDLIMMASHGRRGITALVIGSETMKVLTHSQIPVLVYR
jgi:nucleotide-binding universal stress UspA family protein